MFRGERIDQCVCITEPEEDGTKSYQWEMTAEFNKVR